MNDVQLGREQVPSFTTEAPARAAETGTAHRKAGAPPGSGRTPGVRARTGRRRGPRSRRHHAGAATLAGLAENRLGILAFRPSPPRAAGAALNVSFCFRNDRHSEATTRSHGGG